MVAAMSNRTNLEIINQTNELARLFYLSMNCEAEKGYCFYSSGHPQELMCWEMACLSQEMLTSTNPEDCLVEEGCI